MTNSFDFGSFSSANAVSTSKRSLKPYGSYKVNFNGVELTTVAKKDDPNITFQVIDIHFEGEEGVFNQRIFYPSRPEDSQRPTYTNANGHEYQRPSRMEEAMYNMLQLLQVLTPEGADKFKANISKCKTFDDAAKLFEKLVNTKKEAEMYIKLTGRNSNGTIYAQLPSPIGLNKSNEIFPVNVFSLKDDFNWSAYELQQKKAYESAKPTQMGGKTEEISLQIDGTSEDDQELDDLLAGL